MSRCALPLLALVSGCTSPAIDWAPQSISSEGATWALRQFAGKQVKRSDPEAATVRFLADHKTVGTSACNDVGGEELTWSADASGEHGAINHDQTRGTITTVVRCSSISAVQLGNCFWADMIKARAWSTTATTLTIEFADRSEARLARVTRNGS